MTLTDAPPGLSRPSPTRSTWRPLVFGVRRAYRPLYLHLVGVVWSLWADLRRRRLQPAEQPTLGVSGETLVDVLFSAVEIGRQIALRTMPLQVQSFGAAGAGRGASLTAELADPTLRRAVEWAERQAAALVTAESAQVVTIIHDLTVNALARGVDVRDLADEIEQVVGLTPRLEGAVRRFEAALRKQGVDPTRIRVLVANYRDRLKAYRASLIARTEVMRALNEGLALHWGDLMAQGILSPLRTLKVWVTAPDERRCDHCAPLHMFKVPYLEMFETDLGPVEHPPLHPNCRCVATLEVD